MVYTEEQIKTAELTCTDCKCTKLASTFSKSFNKETKRYYVQKLCNKCHYIRKRKRYADKNEDYRAKQKYNELYTLEGRASLLRNRCKQRAKRDGYDFDLSKSNIVGKLKDGVCEVTGINFHFGELNIHPYAPSIDRLDKNKGYIDNNIQVVCMIYNFCKNEFTDSDVFDFIRKVKVNGI